jgi:glycosyltransferase involved in cell wall biosynthesis
MRMTLPDSSLKRPLFVDARKAQGAKTGVGHYANQLISEFLQLSDDVIPVRGNGFIWHLKTAREVRRLKGARYFSPESLIVPLLVGKRSTVTVHDLSPLTHPNRHTLRNRAVHTMLLSATLRRVGAIVVPTEAVRQDFARYFPAHLPKIHVIHEGTRFSGRVDRPFKGRNQRTVSFLGTVEPRKNVALLCQAFLEANPGNWKLQVAGKIGWLSESERQQFDAIVASEHIDYLGYLADEEVQSFYESTSIFVYPSEAEGFGLPPLEAMGFGIPVVVSSDPALVEVVGEAGEVVDLGDNFGGRLSLTLGEIMRSESRMTEMSQSSLSRSSEFSWERAAKLTLQVISSL